MNITNQTHAGFIRRTFALLASLALLTAAAQAQVPTMISYQGRVLMNNANFNGTGQFKFALVNGAGNVTFWSNDGSSVGGAQPTAAVSLSVANGLVMTLLGDTSLANMTAIPALVFNNSDVRVRVWFNGGAGFEQLTPDQRIVSVGYAVMAGNVPDGAITSAKLANGAVTVGKIANDAIGAAQIAPGAVNSSDIADGSILGVDLANNTVGSAQVADDLDLGDASTVGRLDVFHTSAGTPSISLFGNSSQISTYGSDGLEQIRLWGVGYGELLLNNALANNATAVRLTAQSSTGGQLELRNTNGSVRALLEGENTGGALTLYQTDGQTGVFIDGDSSGAGLLTVRSTNGSTRVLIDGLSTGGGGEVSVNDVDGTKVVELLATSVGGSITLRDETGQSTAFLGSSSVGGYLYLYDNNGQLSLWADGDNGGAGYLSIRNTNASSRVVLDGFSTGGGGEISVYDATGTETIEILGAESSAAGGQILMRNASGVNTIQLDSDASGVACGYLALYQSNGVANIILDSAAGTVRGQVVEITGGSDFSEKFDINAKDLEAGMIVSIDPKNPGQLTLSESVHDKKVAGIVSGAGGVKPGMLMGQRGSVADGKHPVALTGRVYCWVDADANGAIEPGDMLTTSATPGHGMKVTDHTRAAGAIVGKAMTGLAKGKGLVLVLVNLQ